MPSLFPGTMKPSLILCVILPGLPSNTRTASWAAASVIPGSSASLLRTAEEHSAMREIITKARVASSRTQRSPLAHSVPGSKGAFWSLRAAPVTARRRAGYVVRKIPSAIAALMCSGGPATGAPSLYRKKRCESYGRFQSRKPSSHQRAQQNERPGSVEIATLRTRWPNTRGLPGLVADERFGGAARRDGKLARVEILLPARAVLRPRRGERRCAPSWRHSRRLIHR
ncbi:hypothetical protein DFJ74DRAFT_725836 [Hyaloraphidium curvatum]|nr:hypothetical protein DFJ74DRAFT_725836 [Hyaloraphidium curvatum]